MYCCKFYYYSLLFHGNLAEEETTCLTAWSNKSAEAVVEEFLGDITLDLADSEGGCVVPDVGAGETSELTSPAESQRDTTEEGQQLVAAAEGTVEAAVTVLPDTVHGVNGVWLSQNIVKFDSG